MNKKCLNCDNIFEQPKGKREKLFCCDVCRAKYNQKSKPNRKYTYEELEQKIVQLYGEENMKMLEEMISKKSAPKTKVTNLAPEKEKSNFTIDNTTKIAELEEELKSIPDRGYGIKRRIFLMGQIAKLKS